MGNGECSLRPFLDFRMMRLAYTNAPVIMDTKRSSASGDGKTLKRWLKSSSTEIQRSNCLRSPPLTLMDSTMPHSARMIPGPSF